MQVVETNSEGLKREFTITVPADEIEAKIAAKLADLSTQVQLRGFRPGKVPVSLLRRMYGKSVLGEVLEETVNSSSQQALQDNSLTPAMQPRIEVDTFDEGTELKYTMAVEVIPDFEPMEFSTLELERLVAPVSDEQVNEALEKLAEQQMTYEPITGKRKSKIGDMLVIDFVGKVDGAEFEGGTATDLQMVLRRGDVTEVDYIVSSLPLSILDDAIADGILNAAQASLKPGGKFLQYQYSLTYLGRLTERYGDVRLGFTLRNVPPAFVYECVNSA